MGELIAQINNYIQLILGVGGGAFVIFQAVFFLKPIDFPIKPSKEFILISLQKRVNTILIIAGLYWLFTGIAMLPLIEIIFLRESFWEVGLFFFFLCIAWGSISTLWFDFVVTPMEKRYVMMFFNSTGYSQNDFKELLRALENSEQDHGGYMNIIYDALGIDKNG